MDLLQCECQILCKTAEEVDELFDFLDSKGFKWNSEKSLTANDSNRYNYLPTKYIHTNIERAKRITHCAIPLADDYELHRFNFDGGCRAFISACLGDEQPIEVDVSTYI